MKKFMTIVCLLVLTVQTIFYAIPSYAGTCTANPACVAILTGSNNIVPFAKTAITTSSPALAKSATITSSLGTTQPLSWASALGFGGLLYSAGELFGVDLNQTTADSLRDIAFDRYREQNAVDPTITYSGPGIAYAVGGNGVVEIPFSVSLSVGPEACNATGFNGLIVDGAEYNPNGGYRPCGSPNFAIDPSTLYFVPATSFDELTPAQQQSAIDTLTPEEISSAIDVVPLPPLSIAPGETLTFDVPLFDETGEEIDSLTNADGQIVPGQTPPSTSVTTETITNPDGTITETSTTDQVCLARFQNSPPFTSTLISTFASKFPFDFIGDLYAPPQSFCFSITVFDRTEQYCELTNLLSGLIYIVSAVLAYNLVTRIA